MPIERHLPENLHRALKAYGAVFDHIERARYQIAQARLCGLDIRLGPSYRPSAEYYSALQIAGAFLDSHEMHTQKMVHGLEKRLGLELSDFSPEHHDESAELHKAALSNGRA